MVGTGGLTRHHDSGAGKVGMAAWPIVDVNCVAKNTVYHRRRRAVMEHEATRSRISRAFPEANIRTRSVVNLRGEFRGKYTERSCRSFQAIRRKYSHEEQTTHLMTTRHLFGAPLPFHTSETQYSLSVRVVKIARSSKIVYRNCLRRYLARMRSMGEVLFEARQTSLEDGGESCVWRGR